MIALFPKLLESKKSKRMGWVCHVARKEEPRNIHRYLVGEPEGKRRLPKFRNRRKENINSVPTIGPARGSCECGTEHLEYT
jgi:hypothetical protein